MDLVRATVFETEHYRQKAVRLLSERECDLIRRSLAENPNVHDVVPGLGGIRKARWGQQSRNKGKRGGVRVIYFYALSADAVVLIDIYSKAEKEDLNAEDKKRLRLAIEEIKRKL
jgi:mRNA-degrading endonuclease RelE of RelBE toxin-antitoxin system